MALDPSKWPTNTQQAVASAIDAAKAASNPELTPDHLLGALLRQEGTVVPAVVQKLGLAPLMLRNRADEAVAKLPHAYGGAEPRLSRETNDVFDRAEASRKDLRDDSLSVAPLPPAINH